MGAQTSANRRLQTHVCQQTSANRRLLAQTSAEADVRHYFTKIPNHLKRYGCAHLRKTSGHAQKVQERKIKEPGDLCSPCPVGRRRRRQTPPSGDGVWAGTPRGGWLASHMGKNPPLLAVASKKVRAPISLFSAHPYRFFPTIAIANANPHPRHANPHPRQASPLLREQGAVFYDFLRGAV